jgi:hypothetical protein
MADLTRAVAGAIDDVAFENQPASNAGANDYV